MAASGMKLPLVLDGAEVIGGVISDSIIISGLAYDSRDVASGDLFFAISGFRVDGHEFIPEARAAGAVAAVVSRRVEDAGMPLILVDNVRRTMAVAAANFYRRPSADLTVIGVTGTNGKTTTTYLIDCILRTAGRRTALFGGIEYRVGDITRKAVRTTPESVTLQELIASAAADKVDTVTMEVSSHGIELYRTACIDFNVAVFTNLSHDHLDLHGGMEDYFKAKHRLFTGADTCLDSDERGKRRPMAVINVDDVYGIRLVGELSAEGMQEVITYGVKTDAHVHALDIKYEDWETAFTLMLPAGRVSVRLGLPGEFNLYNSLAAAAVGAALEIPLAEIKQGLESFNGVPGRFEPVDTEAPFKVIIDYAHNEDGLRRVLEAARKITSGRLIVVFGCPGERDRDKRPAMGRIAGDAADLAILTTDDCYSEAPSDILDAVESGLKETDREYLRISDRRRAIEAAVESALKGDTVLIAGKGHEQVQIMAGGPVPFSDRETVIEALAKIC